MRSRILAITAGVLFFTLVPIGAASASEETIGSCIAEELIHLEEEGVEFVELFETAEAGDEVAAEELEKAEEDLEDCVEAPQAILPELNEIIWGGLAFLLLFALMMWKGFPAVKNIMNKRSEQIASDLDAAETARVEAEKVRADYQAELADAKTEASRIIEDARQQADVVRADLQTRAESDIAGMREQAAADVEAGRSQAMADLQAEVSDIVVGAAERVVGANLDRQAQIQLIENYINEVGSK